MIVLGGCTQQPQAEKIDPSLVKDFADPAVERMLTATNEGNYEKFSQDFDAQMKAAMTEQKFKESSAQIKSQLGDYQAKQLVAADKIQGNTRAVYSAKFTKAQKDATVTIVFSDNNGKMMVAGFFVSF